MKPLPNKKPPYRILGFSDYDIKFIQQALKIASQVYSSASTLKYINGGAKGEKQRKMVVKHCKKLAHFYDLMEADISNGLHDQN